MEFHWFIIILTISCGNTYGQIQSCWLKSCEMIENIETFANTIIEKQDNMTNMMADGPDVSMFADIESNITATLANKTDTSELNVITAFIDTTNDIVAALNGSVFDIVTKVNETTVMELGATEGNVISTINAHIDTAESSVISALTNKTDEVIAALNTGISDSVLKINETISAEVGKSEANIVVSIAANITASESNVISALTSQTDDLTASFNSNISDAIIKINDTITDVVGTSESNVVSEVMSELNATANDIVATVTAEIEASRQNLSMKIDELTAIISSLQPPVTSGFNVGSIVKGE